MRTADFTFDKQVLFRKSLAAAAAAGVSEADVTIDRIETIKGGRRLLLETCCALQHQSVQRSCGWHYGLSPD